MVQNIPFSTTHVFSKTFLDYILENEKLRPFYGLSPSIENFQTQLSQKNISQETRTILSETLIAQYQNCSAEEAVIKNIKSLTDNKTFTITTGHQLSIFGGPLYFIYKIITTINTATQLQKAYPDCHFVPVFWMAGEDHDFEEINHFHWFGKTYRWETNQKGAVGRFSLEGFDSVLESLPEKIALFENAYRNHSTLADATRYFVNELFGSYGLIVLDADCRPLKKLFQSVLKDEITHKSSFQIVEQTNSKLKTQGYEPQIHARPINLFYLDKNLRERILYEEGKYKINNTNFVFSETEILQITETEPEKFSPNVVLRPLYQEIILPNLAYIGGPAEVTYWLQLKSVFEYHKITFPILMPRNFALYINKSNFSKLTKLDISPESFFKPVHELKSDFLGKITHQEFVLNEEAEQIKQLFLAIKEKAVTIDKTLEPSVLAELQKVLKIMEVLEHKLKKADERKNETVITQLLHLKEKLFPDGKLQERHDNFLNFYINNNSFISELIDTFNAFETSFYIISEDE